MEEAALALGIDQLLDRSTAELSGGELQRVALGAALAGRPRVVVLDEPTSQLDPVAGDELIGLLRRVNEDSDATIVLAEHRLERCLGAADRIIALAGGRIVCDAAPDRVPGVGGPRGARPSRPRGRGCWALVGRPRSRASSARGRRCARAGLLPAAGRAGCGPLVAAPGGGGRAGARRARRRSPRWPSSTSGTSCAPARRSCAMSRSRWRPASGWR